MCHCQIYVSDNAFHKSVVWVAEAEVVQGFIIPVPKVWGVMEQSGETVEKMLAASKYLVLLYLSHRSLEAVGPLVLED